MRPELPASAAWRHQEAREGFESVFFSADGSGYRLDGHTAAVEDGVAWAVRYAITLDERWITRAARVEGQSPSGERSIRLDADGAGRWEVDGSPMPALDGCLDLDLESSACTNTLPMRRLGLGVGQSADAPAAYVRAVDLRVEALAQTYRRLADDRERERYEYRALRFEFECLLVYDEFGLVLDYPGIATRVR